MRGKKGMNLKRMLRKRRREKKKKFLEAREIQNLKSKSKVEKVKINLRKKSSFKKDKSVARSLT